MASDAKKESVLAAKLTERYAKGDAAITAYIEQEVRNWLRSRNGKKLTASDIQGFERRVEGGVKKLQQTMAEKAAGPSHHDVPLANERKPSAREASDKTEDGKAVPLSYLVYAEASSLEYEQMKRAERRRNQMKKLELKEELDRQIDENKNKDDAAKQIEAEYATNVLKNYADFRSQEKRAKELHTQKLAELKYERDRHMAELDRRRAFEQAREKAEEAAMIDAARSALKQEEERRRQAMLEQKAFMDRVIAENEENKRLRAIERKRIWDEEKKLQQEQAQRLDDQERMRAETFARMKAKSSQNQQMYLAATAEKTAKEKEDEAKALAYQHDKVRRDMEALEQEKRNRALEKERLRQALAEQVADKQRREEEEAQAKSEFVELYRAQAEQAIKDDKDAQRRARQRAIEHRLQLQKQIEEKQQREDETSTSVMTDAEKLLNKKSIHKLVGSDSEVVKTITIKLEQAKKVEDAKKRRALGIRGGPADLKDDELFF